MLTVSVSVSGTTSACIAEIVEMIWSDAAPSKSGVGLNDKPFSAVFTLVSVPVKTMVASAVVTSASREGEAQARCTERHRAVGGRQRDLEWDSTRRRASATEI